MVGAKVTNVLNDEVVFVDRPFLILKSSRIFGTGFNVYKEYKETSQEGEKVNFLKLNKEFHYFGTIEAAMEFLKKQKAEYERVESTPKLPTA